MRAWHGTVRRGASGAGGAEREVCARGGGARGGRGAGAGWAQAGVEGGSVRSFGTTAELASRYYMHARIQTS